MGDDHTNKDPLKDEALLHEGAQEQARLLQAANNTGDDDDDDPTISTTGMEFCRGVIQKQLGFKDFGVSAYQRRVISEARKAALGKADEVLVRKAPQPAMKVELPPFQETVDAILEDVEGKRAAGHHDSADDDNNNSTNPPQKRMFTKERLLDVFDNEKLAREGILHLPGLVTEQECCAILQQLSLTGIRKDKPKPTFLRASTGNGMNGAYENIRTPHPALLSDLGTALSEMLKDTMGVDSGSKPILLQYTDKGVNWAHQDQSKFPYQALLLVSRPNIDFAGGELYVIDSTSDSTSKEAHPVPFHGMGDVVVFAANQLGHHHWYHGMKEVRPGSRGAGNKCHRIAIGLLQSDDGKQSSTKKRKR